MSLTNPDKVVTEQRLSEFYTQIFPYLGGTAEAGFTPVGTVIAVMGNSAPANYLACNGQTVNIADYPILADYFFNQFGSKNYFGGDGTTTFGIPDLRGEFLRGTGANSHSGQGSGANVGTHQDGTEHSYSYINASNNQLTQLTNDVVTSLESTYDTLKTQIGARRYGGSFAGGDNYGQSYTSRPTNTSVLYCIATKNIFLNPAMNYSTSECVVGTWIDGKPIYQKSYTVNVTQTGTMFSVEANFTANHNVDTVVKIEANIKSSDHAGLQAGGQYYNTSSDLLRAWVSDATSYGLSMFVGTSYPGKGTAHVTVFYTKTTD